METEMYGPDRQFGNFLLTRYINTLHATENKKVDLTLTYCTLKKKKSYFLLVPSSKSARNGTKAKIYEFKNN